MFRHAILITALCAFTTASYAQYYPNYQPPDYYPVPEDQYFYPVPPQQYADPPVQRYRQSDLSYKCAQASEYIRNNNCGPQGCDIGLCIALQHGCRINHWGHTCPWGR